MAETLEIGKSFGKLGFDVGSVGRWFRLIAGGFFTGYVIYHQAHSPSIGEITKLGLFFVATLGTYTLAIFFLGKILLANSNAWLNTLIFLGPLVVIFGFQLGPHIFHHSIILYVGVSFIFSVFMRYGGCEVTSIPSLIFGARYTVYCPLNAVDVVEKAIVDRRT